MARKKKEKIRVELNLPKDDKTQTTFLAILMVGVMMGLFCFGFWITQGLGNLLGECFALGGS